MYIRKKLPCEICGRMAHSRYNCNGTKMCKKHYGQFIKYGKAIDKNPRTCNDLNEYVINGNIAIFKVYNSKSEPINEFIVDKTDVDLIKGRKWCRSSSSGYILSGNNFGENKRIPLHRFLLFEDRPDYKIVDHINNNKLDNRRSNLRIVTSMQNVRNKSLQQGKRKNKLGVAGVYETNKKYAVEIRYNNNRLHLSSFDKFEDAVYTRFVAEIILFKEFRHKGNDKTIFMQIDKIQPDKKYQLIEYVVSRVSRIY